MVAKSAQSRPGEGAAEASAALGRMVSDMMQNASAIPVHPLMAHQAAAFATATAIGFSVSTQMANAFFGMIEGAAEAARLLATPVEKPTAEPVAAEPAEKTKVVEKAVTAAAPERVAVEPPAAKPRVEKPVAAKVKSVVEAAVKAVKPRAKIEPVAGRKVSQKADDLKLISGIGPKLEMVLNERGYRSFVDIAAWTIDDVVRIDTELGFEGRIARDDWVGQAKAFAAQPKGRR